MFKRKEDKKRSELFKRRSQLIWRHRVTSFLKPYAISLGFVLLTIILVEAMLFLLPAESLFESRLYSISMMFLLACVTSAVSYGLMPGIFTALCGFMVLNLFYTRPIFSDVSETQDIVSLGLFLITAIVASGISGRSLRQNQLIRKREILANALYRLNKIIAETPQPELLSKKLSKELPEILETDTRLFFGSAADIDLGPLFHKEPIKTPSTNLGTLAVRIPNDRKKDTNYFRLISALSAQVAVAFERAELWRDAEVMRLQQEKEKLRSALLSSVSHDLKTPLASIIGSLSAIQHMAGTLPEEARNTLIATALEEAERLNNFITNILNMARLESGAFTPHKQWLNPDLLVDDALRRLRTKLNKHSIKFEPQGQAVEVEIDGTLIDQMLGHLIDNAAKYSNPGNSITVRTFIEKKGKQKLDWKLQIRDTGVGIPEMSRELIFNKFTRIERQDSQIAGTGLGLAISKAIADIHNAKIEVSTNEEASNGAVFTLTLNNARAINNKELPSNVVPLKTGAA